jgi:hypothetical protein
MNELAIERTIELGCRMKFSLQAVLRRIWIWRCMLQRAAEKNFIVRLSSAMTHLGLHHCSGGALGDCEESLYCYV